MDVLGDGDKNGSESLNRGTVDFYKDHETVEKIKAMKEDYKTNKSAIKKMENE